MVKQFFLFLSICFCISSIEAQPLEYHVLDENDPVSGNYLAIPPASGTIDGVLFLMPGFGQNAANIIPESKLQNVAFNNNLLTILFAGGRKLYLDEELLPKMNATMKDVLERYEVPSDKFVLGGFSAGGIIALRYTELCKQFPEEYPIQPKGVFVVDSPIDIFTIWNNFEESLALNSSPIAVNEANFIMDILRKEHGVPSENIEIYSHLSPFSMNKAYGENEKWLKDTPVRTYHDVDVMWRLKERNQSVRVQNYLMTAEFINRLLLLGNEQAEFIQSYQTGYRSDGRRHPHSWSVVEEVECIQWIKSIL